MILRFPEELSMNFLPVFEQELVMRFRLALITTSATQRGTILREVEAKNGGISRERNTKRISTSIKKSVTNRMTRPLVTHLMNNGIPLDEA